MLRRSLSGLGLAFASLLLVLLLLEGVVRLLVPEAMWRFRDGNQDWQVDREIGWVNQPNLDVSSVGLGGLVRFRTNPDGLIPAQARRPRPPDTARIMVFGDSMVVGRDVAQADVYTARLESILRQRGLRVEVINAGVLGYSTDQALLLMERWLPVYRPDVVLYGSTLNDFGGNELATAHSQAKPRFRLEGGGELRLERPAASNEIHALASGPRTWIQRSALYRALQPRLVVLRARLLGRDERLLMGDLEGIYADPAIRDSLDWELYGALVERMQRVARDHGARFLFFAHPEAGEVWEPFIQQVCERIGVPRSAYDPFSMQRRVAEVAAAHGVPFLALIDAFRVRSERGPFHLLPYDLHLNVRGHQLLAEVLADHLTDGEFAPLLETGGAGTRGRSPSSPAAPQAASRINRNSVVMRIRMVGNSTRWGSQ